MTTPEQASRKLRVRSPDGRTFVVQAPAGATEEEILSRVQARAKTPKGFPKAPPSLKDQAAGVAGNFLDGILPGSAGFVRGASEVLKNAVRAPFDASEDFEPGKAYAKGQRFQEDRQKAAARDHPTASNWAAGAGIGAGILLPAAKIAKGATLAQKVKAGAKTAGAYGALSGAMSSKAEGITDKVTDALSSGALSGLVGAALPVGGKVAGTLASPFRPIVQPVVRKVGEGMEALGTVLPGALGGWVSREGSQLARDPVEAAANLHLGKAIRTAQHPQTAAPLRPAQVPGEVGRRQALGVPAVAADLDTGLQRRLRVATREPGPVLQSVRSAIDERQRKESERAARHLDAALGPIANVQQQAQSLNEQARRAAAPLYERSDAQAIPLVPELQELFSRPTGRQAIDHARTSLQDQGQRPVTMGRIMNPDGSWSEGQVPTMQAYDQAKTFLDDAIFASRSPFATPDVQRDARGATAIRKRLLELMDGADGLPQGPLGSAGAAKGEEALDVAASAEGVPGPWTGQRLHPETEGGASAVPAEGLNPYWKPARDAYAGPVQNRKALELGEELIKSDAQDIAARLGNMSPDQVQHFRLGHRSGLAGDVKSLRDYGVASKRLAGSLEKREALEAAHGPDKAQALMDRLDPEMDATATWQTIRGPIRGGNISAETGGQIEDGASGILQMLAGRPIAGALSMGRALLKGDRSGPAVEGHVARVLAEPSVPALTSAMRSVQREEARKAVVSRNAGRAMQQGGRFLGGVLGTNMVEPVDDINNY